MEQNLIRRRAYPNATEVERDEIFVRELYGQEAARNVIRLRVEKGFYDRGATDRAVAPPRDQQ